MLNQRAKADFAGAQPGFGLSLLVAQPTRFQRVNHCRAEPGQPILEQVVGCSLLHNGNRLFFAERSELDIHLARHSLADLFLDTLPYGAHATAADALWAGLPVLTQMCGIFPGRVGASLLTAAGLPELITHSPEEYEATALALARDPARLKAIVEKLAANRTSAPLFDMARFTRNLETAYDRMLAERLRDYKKQSV